MPPPLHSDLHPRPRPPAPSPSPSSARPRPPARPSAPFRKLSVRVSQSTNAPRGGRRALRHSRTPLPLTNQVEKGQVVIPTNLPLPALIGLVIARTGVVLTLWTYQQISEYPPLTRRESARIRGTRVGFRTFPPPPVHLVSAVSPSVCSESASIICDNNLEQLIPGSIGDAAPPRR